MGPDRLPSTYSLTPEEVRRLLRTCREPSYHPRYWEGADPYRVTVWYLTTGMHPVVLSDPARYGLTISGSVEPYERWLQWQRPKKRGADATTVAMIPLRYRDEMEQFYAWITERTVKERSGRAPVVQQPHARSVDIQERFFRQLGMACVPTIPHLGPRVLRHTYVTHALFGRGLISSGVQLVANVNERQSIVYSRPVDSMQVQRGIKDVPFPWEERA